MNTGQRVRFLAHARLRSHRERVERSRAMVREALGRCAHPYLALSGGKDSSCVANLVWAECPDVPAVYFDAQCAYPEVLDYLTLLGSQGRRIIRWPCRPFLDTLREHGLHSDALEKATMRDTVYEPLERLYREHGYDAVFLGLRREESPGRAAMLANYGTAFVRKSDGVLECNPVAYWSFADVFAFLLDNDLPYCAAYDRLFAMGLPEKAIRLSYWAGESGRRWGRYEALKRGWPELWRQLCDAVPEVTHFA